MPTIDIPLPEALHGGAGRAQCVDLSLPKPNLPELRLPTGGTIKGVADITKGIPSDCSMNVNLALQIAPIMASMECLLKVLKFLGVADRGRSSNLRGRPVRAHPAGLLQDRRRGADDLMPCIGMPLVPDHPVRAVHQGSCC